MPTERLKSPRARLFVALELPDRIREGLATWQRRALRDPVLRPSRPETLHFTLAFLGYHQERRIDDISQAVTAARSAAPELSLQPELVALPKREPRLFAIAAESPETVALQAQVSERLVAAGFYRPEKRPFWPHMTVARVRSQGRGRRRPREVREVPGRLPDELLEPFRGVRVTLYRSNLRPTGAEYVSLASLKLPSG